ncbi:MAG: thioredoxin family protein [Pelagibacteraceae bacterium]|nr:thioredoxin family protein [Pelagibacteraceae bacterium]|tara:strand:- start:669 stop:1214 length:546 start_codon:yes stop_codon:yes gene_type:complete
MPISSASCNFNWKPTNFSLSDLEDNEVNFYDSFGQNGLLVMFICNHCPYVNSIEKKIKYETDMLFDLGINSLAIMSNDQNEYLEDSLENLRIQSNKNNFKFPYLIDKEQLIAKNFKALCTPDFFGFNSDKTLQYRGRLDSLGRDPEIGERELYLAMSEIGEKKYTSNPQFPSMGCSIKWKI